MRDLGPARGPLALRVDAALWGAVAVGAVALGLQLVEGMGITGLQQPVFWGVYTINFVYFIGIAHAGTLISAVLRLVGVTWTRPISRMAEVITLVMLCIGALQLLFHVGRPDRAPLFMILYGRFQSPLVWDLISITAYLLASALYLYLPLIPDLARLRDRGGHVAWVYAVLALGWVGNPGQTVVLRRAVNTMAVLVVPIAITVHSVIAFIFVSTLQPLWHSTIFPPYFVVGAIYSGLGAILVTMAVVRVSYELQDRLTDLHFRRLGRLFLVFALVWLYFTAVEHLAVGYSGGAHEREVLWRRFVGAEAPLFWTMIAANGLVPLLCLVSLRRSPMPKTVMAAGAVLIGMWLERYLIVVPSLMAPRLPVAVVSYWPSWVEAGVMLGSLGLFMLGFLAFGRLVPLLPVVELDDPVPANPASRSDGAVLRIVQQAVGGFVVLAVLGVCVWIGLLVDRAFLLDDVPWVAVAVGSVAVPVFLTMAAVVAVVTIILPGARDSAQG